MKHLKLIFYVLIDALFAILLKLIEVIFSSFFSFMLALTIVIIFCITIICNL